jgi:hypothetical protein
VRFAEEIAMSTDKKVTEELMETLQDGHLGYEKAAETVIN